MRGVAIDRNAAIIARPLTLLSREAGRGDGAARQSPGMTERAIATDRLGRARNEVRHGGRWRV